MTDEVRETDSTSEVEPEIYDTKVAHLSQKGQRMAKAIAEYIFMRYFFPEIPDKKRQNAIKNAFLSDMQYDLTTGLVN
jgi:hypothetical protein